MKKTIEEVVNAFKNHGSNISYESKKILRNAIQLLDNLQKMALSEYGLKKQADIIIVGAIIAAYIVEDNKYYLQSKYGNKFLYPLSFEDILAPSELDKFYGNLNNIIPKIGQRALLVKDIPFTGTIDYRVFPLLEEVGIGAAHFASYELNTDPLTIDTTKRSLLAEDNREISNKLHTIETILRNLQYKIGEKYQHRAHKAPSAAKKLLNELTSAKNEYKAKLEAELTKSHEEYQANAGLIGQEFMDTCTKAIGLAKSKLVNDLDWGSYLQNLLINLANAVISGYNKVTGTGISFFETNVANSVKEIEKSENKLRQGK